MRKTTAQKVSYRGIGIHTGETSSVVIHPGDGRGILFYVNGVEIPALLSHKIADARCTVLGRDNMIVMTVEHLLATLYAFEIDDCIIEMCSGREMPIGDGSALHWCALLHEAGQNVTEGISTVTPVRNSLVYNDDRVTITAQPDDRFCVDFLFDGTQFNYEQQEIAFTVTPEVFEKEIAPARTFGFWQEIELLRAQGLAAGGSFENALVIKDGLPYNTEYRMPKEPVRHKVLDFIGDIALIGKRVRGSFRAERSGHYHNNRFAVQLSKEL